MILAYPLLPIVDGNDRSIVGFVMVGHTMVHTLELSVPILMTIWLLEFSTSAAILGVAVSIGYALFGIGALPGGLLVDRYGSQTLISLCLAGMGVAFLALSVAPGVISIAVALAVWGIAASVYHPAGLTLISNGVEERGRGFAYHGMAGNAGIAIGPLLTAILLLVFDWRIVTAILAVLALGAAVLGRSVEFDAAAAVEMTDGGLQRRTPSSIADLTRDTKQLFTRGFLLVFVIVAFNGLFYRGFLTFLPELLSDFLRTVIGDIRPPIFDAGSPMAESFDLAQYLYVGLLTIGIAGQYLGGRLTDVTEPDRGLAYMLALLTALALLFVPAASTALWALLAVSFLLGFALFAMQPLTQATIAKYSLPEARGLSFGYTYLGIFGIGALGAAISGGVLTYSSVTAMFVVLATFSAIGAIVAIGLVSRQ